MADAPFFADPDYGDADEPLLKPLQRFDLQVKLLHALQILDDPAPYVEAIRRLENVDYPPDATGEAQWRHDLQRKETVDLAWLEFQLTLWKPFVQNLVEEGVLPHGDDLHRAVNRLVTYAGADNQDLTPQQAQDKERLLHLFRAVLEANRRNVRQGVYSVATTQTDPLPHHVRQRQRASCRRIPPCRSWCPSWCPI
jgi:hypothetical protein